MPTDDDILRARVTTTGIIETRFDMGNLSIQYVSCFSGLMMQYVRCWGPTIRTEKVDSLF